MPETQITVLVVSTSLALLDSIETVLVDFGAQVKAETSARRALEVMNGTEPPSLLLLDGDVPGTELDRLFVSMRTETGSRRFPIVLISDTVAQQSLHRLDAGEIDDLILKSAQTSYWRLRLKSVMRNFRGSIGLGQSRRTVTPSSQSAPLTVTDEQPEIVSLLFRETDRVQRMKTSLCLMLVEIDAREQNAWGAGGRDEVCVQIVGRMQRLLRSYDIFGRIGKNRFLLGLPGCSPANAMMLAGRICFKVFSAPFCLRDQITILSARFGIAASLGRSPIIVLREAEKALQQAQAGGRFSIRCADSCPRMQEAEPMSPAASGHDPARW